MNLVKLSTNLLFTLFLMSCFESPISFRENWSMQPNITHVTLITNIENGTIQLEPLKEKYLSGETVTITVTPDTGFDFYSWEGDIVSSEYPLKIVMDDNKTITAKLISIPVGKIYYVDYEGGSDDNNGLSETTAWKHAPGDSNATGYPKNTTLEPGNEIHFKRGVSYRGSISSIASGSLNYPVKYIGNSWGTTGKAILDGGNLLTGWTKCTSKEECYDNDNYENIFYTTLTGSYNLLQLSLHELNTSTSENEFLWMSQYPVPATEMDQYFFETAPSITVARANITRTSITDPAIFNQSDPSYWDNVYLLIYHRSARVSYRKILTYNPSTYTVTFEDLGADTIHLTSDTYHKYAIYNSTKHITSAGKYSVIEESANNFKIFLWPLYSTETNINSRVSFSSKEFGIDTNKYNNIVIDGFTVRMFKNPGLGTYNSDYLYKSNITIRNCVITHNYSGSSIRLSKVKKALIENNVIFDNPGQSAIYASNSSNIKVRNNSISRTGNSSVRLFTVEMGEIIDNIIDKCNGTHSNGITMYIGCHNILVGRNKILDSDSSITIQDSGNIYIINNLIDRLGVSEWPDAQPDPAFGDIMFLNNTIPNTGVKFSRADPNNSYIFVNNLVAGLASNGEVTRYNNIYTNPYYSQGTTSFPYQTGESVFTDLAAIFEDPANGDYSLKTGSPAIGTGVDISDLFPAKLFPDFDFKVDINGNYRNSWDIGAYSY